MSADFISLESPESGLRRLVPSLTPSFAEFGLRCVVHGGSVP